MKHQRLIKIKGYGLIKLLAVISIIGLIIFLLAMLLNIRRMNGRDAARVEDIATIKLALVTYLNDSLTGYPASTGECLNADVGVGAELKTAKAFLDVPVDPLWPAIAPTSVTNGVPDPGQKDFCYFYYSGAMDQYKISFFLESNSGAGQSGQHLITQ